MERVGQLWPDEPPSVDEERLADLYVELGEAQATSRIIAVSGEISTAMDLVMAARHVDDLMAVNSAARQMCRLAQSIGMSGVAQVAADVAGLAPHGCNCAALPACIARLERLVNRSLRMVGQLHDRSGS